MRTIILAAALVSIMAGASAQTAPPAPSMALEMQYLKPKRGMEDKLEAALKAHDTKFHPAGPYAASVRKVDYGQRGGYYCWIFGPTEYGNLDTRPAKENGHSQDWDQTVDPLVEEYGPTLLFDFNQNLSYGLDIMRKSKYSELWLITLKPGEYYRFKAMMEKLKKVYESLGTNAFLVMNNDVHTKGGPDVAVAWSFNTFKQWSDDPGPKAAFEKMYGDGSWDNFIKDWMDILVDYSSEIREQVN
jgi:hypothetical protein